MPEMVLPNIEDTSAPFHQHRPGFRIRQYLQRQLLLQTRQWQDGRNIDASRAKPLVTSCQWVF